MDIQGWVSAAATIGFGVYQSFYAKRAVVLQEKAMRGQALAVEVEKAESWVKRHWRKSVPLGVMLACWVPYFATPRYPIDYFMGWGSLGDRAWVVIDTSKLMQEKPNRLMVVARAVNSATDEKTDAQIARSATFEISPTPMRMDVYFTPELARAFEAAKTGVLQEYLLEVPEDFPIEAVHTLADAEKRGARILGSKSGGTKH